MAYEALQLNQELHISAVYTVHYFEYRSDFHFPGEVHDFWEFQCIDKGSAKVCTDEAIYHLSRGQVIFHKPNEFHTMEAEGKTPPNIVVVSFACDSPCMKFFKNRILTISEWERSLLGMLIAEARRCIASPLDDPYLQKMNMRPDCLFGSQQLLVLYLEQLLISMFRQSYYIIHQYYLINNTI